MKKAIQMWLKFTTEVLEQDKLQKAINKIKQRFTFYKASGVVPYSTGIELTDTGFYVYGFGIWDHCFREEDDAIEYHNLLEAERLNEARVNLATF